MRCIRCKSLNISRFVDGFGERRVFCRNCGRSFLENTFIHFGNQSNLVEFDNKLHYNPQAIRIRGRW